GKLQSSDVTVIEPADSLRERAGKLGVKAVKNSAEISDTPRLVIIAVKPQVIQDILPDYKPYAASATFLSVAAGTPVA
ncbi:NAD(P)-binding domain-containing protein, partial [Ochrobactrum sp. SFR4]|uniref:pyrroline-5-carboxylate reductase family protein n=1 Tax=Ochrobactrum sp. SFR4 TaxID=2717368 RepID=UPI001C8CB6BE